MKAPTHETAAEVASRITVPTAAELATWPVTISVVQAGTALGLGREASYRAAAAGELPGAIRVGRRWRVVTARLRDALGVGSDPPGNGESRPRATDGSTGTETGGHDMGSTGSLLRSVAADGGDRQ